MIYGYAEEKESNEELIKKIKDSGFHSLELPTGHIIVRYYDLWGNIYAILYDKKGNIEQISV